MQDEEMAQWGECLPFKYEDLSSGLPNPTKWLSMVMAGVCLQP